MKKNKTDTFIRSSFHSLKFANKDKQVTLSNILGESRRVIQSIVDRMWSEGINQDGVEFNVHLNKLKCPSFLPTSYLKKENTWLSSRMLSLCGSHACSSIRAAVKKKDKQLYMLKKLQQEGEKTKYLQRKIDRFGLVKPNTTNMNLEFDKKFIDFRMGNHFDLFCRFTSIGDGIKVKVPLQHTKVSRKWLSKGNLKTTLRLTDRGIALLFEVPKPPIKVEGRTVGADQGSVTALTLSDAQTTGKCLHGHDLHSIQQKLARRKVGSKGFERAQIHRKNYINWAINQLDFSDIKKLNLEKIRNLRKGSRTSRSLRHWTYTLINQKLIRLGEEEGFVVVEVPNEFRSQRCSQCGWVRKANRKGKTFKCNICGFTADSDLNAASNLELDLYEVPYWVRLKRLNLKGFYWTPSGLFTLSQELIVPDTNKTQSLE